MSSSCLTRQRVLTQKVLQITDFGFSNIDDGTPVSGFIGTITYAAPEVLHAALPGSTATYLRKPTDIWSLGVIIYTMLFRKFPYDCDDRPSLLRLIHSTGVIVPRKHEHVKVGENGLGSPVFLGKAREKLEIRKMLQGMFERDPIARLTIKQIKDHASWNTPSAWIKPGSYPPKFDWEALQSRKFPAPIRPSKDFQKYIDTETLYEFDKVVTEVSTS
ncbi:protein kinase domain-containing protein [Ditylenchus destructor]|uniref:Protein kinase domain-containing protein n=1 Tax=Ditylenchus destructor TaxID=166010 RepID=A0AAD4ML28_9BILA|nr:protein kinase domain-containing protein [Ditylenchus destructor]